MHIVYLISNHFTINMQMTCNYVYHSTQLTGTLSDIESCASAVSRWFIENALLLNPTKTEAVVVGTSHQRLCQVNKSQGVCVKCSSLTPSICLEGYAENGGLENGGPNRRGGKDGTGKHGTKAHVWNSRDWKTQDQISRVENAQPPSIELKMDHGLRGSASPVLTATGFVNGRWQFSTPHRINTP